MKFLKAFLFGFALWWGFGDLAPAQAQNCPQPQVGVNCANVRQATYSAVILSLVPVASATDFFCISGSASKTVQVSRIEISGTAGTLVTTPVTLVRRTSLDTGTAATSTYLKASTGLRSANAAATATVVAYNSTGGNPTIVDSSPTYIRSGVVTLGLSGTTTSSSALNWLFGTSQEAYDQGLTIPSGSTAQQLCLNLNGVSISSGVVQGYMEWTEY